MKDFNGNNYNIINGVAVYDCICRDCSKPYTNHNYKNSWCKDCIDKYNTPEVILARKLYQETAEYLDKAKNTLGLIVPKGKYAIITPEGVTYATKEAIEKQIIELETELREETRRIASKIISLKASIAS